jgi:ubiquinone/menaquinone biosynthesis C-methylase UbiE
MARSLENKISLENENFMEKRQVKEQAHFDKLVETTGATWWGNITLAGIARLQKRAHLVAQELNQFKEPEVLELGCGMGEFSRFVLEMFPLLHLTGCDISPQAVQRATKLYDSYKNVCFEVTDAASMHYNSDVFDAVIGRSILHHLPVELSLTECFRVLKPGGILWFSEPNMMNPQIAIEKNVRFIGKMLQNTDDETAFFRWSLAKILRRVGFQEISVEPFDFLYPLVPKPLIGLVDSIGRLLEKIPLIREIAGSVLIYARKPVTSTIPHY